MSRRVLTCGCALLTGQVACELDRVNIAGGEPVLVVHGILRPDVSRQLVIVEHSWTGDVDPAEGDDNFLIPPNQPQLPVGGATVTVENLDLPNDPCGVVAFAEISSNSGLYWSPPSCPTMRTGDRMALMITTSGQTVRGVTRVPGLDSAVLMTAVDSVRFDGGDTTAFNRDADTLRIAMWTSAGRLMQLEVGRLNHLGEVVSDASELTTIHADTTAVVLPGTIVDVFERGEGFEVFRAGRNYLVTVAAADTNYFDFVRSFNRPVTGRGFINRLEGAIGVFGSVVVGNTYVQAIGNLDDPREGTYRLTGRLAVAGFDLDATLSQYLRFADSSEVYGFLSGMWFRHSGGGMGGPEVIVPWDPNGLSVEGTFRGDQWRVYIRQPRPAVGGSYELRLDGTRAGGADFTVTALEVVVGGFRPLGTLTVRQQ